MTEASGSPTTTIHLINIGLINITTVQIFSGYIRKWLDKDTTNSNWTTFKAHFSTSRRAIKHSQLQHTVSNLGFHQKSNAASIAEKFIQRIDIQQSKETARSNTIAA